MFMKKSLKQILAFTAAALLTMGCTKPFVIVQVADVQMGFAAAATAGKSGEECADDMTFELECLNKVVEIVNEICPDVVVFTGDQVNVAGKQSQWDVFDEAVRGIKSEVKLLYLPGNHDVVISGGRVDSGEFISRYGTDRFCYCTNGVKLVGLNTNLIAHDDSQEAEQIDWLEGVLKKKTGRENCTIVFGHHPFFLNDIDEPDSYFPIMKAKRHLYFDLFAAGSVDAVYAGHRHETFDSSFSGIPMKTTTSAAYQIGSSKPSLRVIVVEKGRIHDELREL